METCPTSNGPRVDFFCGWPPFKLCVNSQFFYRARVSTSLRDNNRVHDYRGAEPKKFVFPFLLFEKKLNPLNSVQVTNYMFLVLFVHPEDPDKSFLGAVLKGVKGTDFFRRSAVKFQEEHKHGVPRKNSVFAEDLAAQGLENFQVEFCFFS